MYQCFIRQTNTVYSVIIVETGMLFLTALIAMYVFQGSNLNKASLICMVQIYTNVQGNGRNPHTYDDYIP